MNPSNLITPIRVALKHLTLAMPLAAAMWLGSGPTAQAQPPVTSGLVLRMDASQITGTADGAQLDTWTDTSGAANNAVRQSGSSAGYPMYVASGINGQPVVRFNSANGNTGDYFKFNRISTIRSVFWVIKGTQANGTHFLLGDDNSYQFHRGYGGNAGKLWDSTYASPNITGGATKLMGGSINGTTTSLPSGFQLVSLVTTGTVEANQICQDRSYNGSWQGDIAEILIYNRALTAPEENQVGYYLGTKYGLTTTYTAPQAPPSDALIHYDFNSVSGTTVTNTGSLGSAADGTLANASLVTGQFGDALSFTGSSSGVITNNNVAIGNAFTLACWVSTTNGNGSYRRIILNDYQQSGYLGTAGDGKYLTIVKDSAGGGFSFSSTPPDTSGAWHHLAMTWDGTTQKFYYDGALNTSTVPTSRDTTYTEKFGFGCNLGRGESWNGKMDDAFVFGRALSAAEVVNLLVNYTPASAPATPTGVAATPASSGTVSLSWPAVPSATTYNVSYKTTVGGTEQVVTGVTASPYTVTGLTNGSSYDFKVSATNAVGTSAYSAVVTATPTLGTAKDILTFVFPGQLNATISGTNISVIMPVGAAVTALAPTYTVSAFATGSPASGTTRDFTSPQTYTITAEDSSTKVYTVTVKTDSRPPVTSGLVVWLAADRVNPADTNQVRIAGADTYVKQWNDGSGNAKNATQAVTGDQPKYIASGVGGKPVLRFTGANDDSGSQMELGDISASFPTAGSMFAVSTITSDGRYSLFDNRNNDSRWVANTWNESVPGVFRDNRQGMTYSTWPQTGSHVFAMESGSGVYRFLNDGAVMGSNAGGNFHSGSGQNWIIGDRPGNSQQLNGDIPEFLLYNRILTADEANAVGAYLAAKYAVTTTYPALPAPTVPTGVAASSVSGTSINVSWTATNAESYNVSVKNTATNAVQVFAAGTSPYTVTGLTGGTTYEFTVQSVNSTGSSAYSSPPATAAPGSSSAKDILTFFVPSLPDGIISGTNISVTVPVGTDVTALAPTYTVSDLATGSPASGTTRNFTSPQTYTITAEDASFQVYTVTVTQGAVASIFTWTTNNSGNWSDSSKWTNDLSNGLRPVTFGQSYYTLNFNQSVTATNDLSANYVVNKLNFGNTVTLAGNSLSLTTDGATLPTINQNSGNQVTITAPLSLAGNTTFGGSNTGAVSISSSITGSGSLSKSNGGELTLSNANTYTGGTNIMAGALTLANQAGLGSGSLTLAAGTTFQQSNFEGNAAAGALPNTIVLSGTGNVTLNMPFSFKDVWLSQVVSGTGGFTVQGGSRQLNLTAANTFSGGVTLTNDSNRIVIWNLASLGTGTFRTERTSTGSGNLETAANLSAGAGVANAVDIASGAYLNVVADGSNHLKLSGAITSAVGTGSLHKTGSAILTLSGSNSYTGTTAVTAGTLLVNGANSGTGAVSVSSSATLGGTGSIGGDVTYASGAFARFTNSGTLAITGTLTLNSNVVRLTLPTALAAGTYTLATYNPTGSTGAFASTPVIDSGSLTAGGSATVSTASGAVTLTVLSSYDIWSNGSFTNAFTDKAAGSDPDGDTLTNLQEYAFGTDPTVSSSGPIAYSGGVLTGYGPPEPSNFAGGANGVDYRMVFCRRKNPASLGLTYTAEFSATLNVWVPNVVTPTVLATDAAGVMEVVSVPYPLFIATVRGVEKPTYSRVKVESN